MMKSAAFRSKTARAPAGSPCRGKPSTDKGLMQSSGLRYRRAYETSRKRTAGPMAALSSTSHIDCRGMSTSINPAAVAITDAMDSSGFDFRRLLYDDRPTDRTVFLGRKAKSAGHV